MLLELNTLNMVLFSYQKEQLSSWLNQTLLVTENITVRKFSTVFLWAMGCKWITSTPRRHVQLYINNLVSKKYVK